MKIKERIKDTGLTSNSMRMPQEEMLEVARKGQKLKIGIPSDIPKVEYRVPLTPQAVELLTSYGHEIWIEKDAGKAASYTNEDYREAGATVVDRAEEIFQCDIILRVAPFSCEEIDMLRGNQLILSNMQMHSHCNESIQKLMKKKITSVAFEYLENEEGFLPIVHQ
jgi:alanine dehydrogenase